MVRDVMLSKEHGWVSAGNSDRWSRYEFPESLGQMKGPEAVSEVQIPWTRKCVAAGVASYPPAGQNA